MIVGKIDKLNRAPRLVLYKRGGITTFPRWWLRTDRANRVKCLRIAGRVIAKILHHVENRGSLLGVAMDNLSPRPRIGQNEGHLDAAILAELSLSQALSEPHQFREKPASLGSLCIDTISRTNRGG
jgi:hypothetical protein